MGQAESEEKATSHIPGFNPELNMATRATRQRQSEAARKQVDALSDNHNVQQAQVAGGHTAKEDSTFHLMWFLRFADATDTIRPIYVSKTSKSHRDSNGGLEFTTDVEISKFIGDMKVQDEKRESGDSQFGDNPLEFDTNDVDEDNNDSSSTDSDSNRGIYHHEQEAKKEEVAPVTSSSAHPVFIKGNCDVGQRIKVVDASPWEKQYPIYSVSWHLGSEIDTQVVFNTISASQERHFTIPPIAVGRYIQVVAVRRVEDQGPDMYTEKNEKGIYDPHVGNIKLLRMGTEKKFVDVASNSVCGPVLISDEWSYCILKALYKGEFSCSVELQDDMTMNEAVERKWSSKGSAANTMIKGSMKVNFSRLELEYRVPRVSKHHKAKTFVSPLEWIQEYFTGNPLATRMTQETIGETDLFRFRLRLKKITCKEGKLDNLIIVMLRQNMKKFRTDSRTAALKDVIPVSIMPPADRDLALCTIRGFQAASVFKLDGIQYWKKQYQDGNVEKGKDLIQQYLEAVGTFENNVPCTQ